MKDIKKTPAAEPNVDPFDCIVEAESQGRLHIDYENSADNDLIDNPRCPLRVTVGIGRTAALYTACEGCPVFDEIQKEERIKEEQVELAREILKNPVVAMREVADLFTQGLRKSSPACEKKVVAELLQLPVALDEQGRKSFLKFGQDKVNNSEQVQALMAYVGEWRFSGRDHDEIVEEDVIVDALIGIFRNLPGMYFRQYAASNGRANGDQVDTSTFTSLNGHLFAYCTSRFQTTLSELQKLVEAGRPNVRHSGIDAIADAQVNGVKGEIAVGRALVGSELGEIMKKVTIRRGTPEEDRKGGDFVVTKKGREPIFLDVKCRRREPVIRVEAAGNGRHTKSIKLIIPEDKVTEGLRLDQKDSAGLLGLIEPLI